MPSTSQNRPSVPAPGSTTSAPPASAPGPSRTSGPIPKPAPIMQNVCIIGDSISGNLDHRVISNVMKSNVRAARAYSTIEDTGENEAKEKTKFPDKSFSSVIQSELKKEEADILIVQAGSVDISNMKTKGNNSKKYGEYFKQQTIISAKNLFTTVCNALACNPSLRKAIIMKLTPSMTQ